MMSPKGLTEAEVRKLVQRDLSALAPRFRLAVEAALAECHAEGLDVVVYEALRTDVVQQAYYALGRTVIPPKYTVTGAKTAMGSWHFYGLAVDVISRSKAWDFTMEWIERVAAIFKKHGCDWGGDWHKRDLPHFQWGQCLPSPTQAARDLFKRGGLPLVWQAVGAAGPAPHTPAVTRPVLKRGMTGEHVAYLQKKLGVVGPNVFGPMTEAAVKKFQADHGLTPDGVVGAKTWVLLDG